MIDERLRDATDGVKAALIDMVPPPIEDLAGDPRVDTHRVAGTSMTRGPLIAIGTAVAILVVVAAGMLVARGGDPSEVVTSATPSTVPATTTPVVSESGFINEVRDLALASDGAIWVATAGGVVRWDPGESIPVVYGEGDGLPTSDVHQIAVAADGTVWAAGNRWVAYFDQTWQTVEIGDDARPSPLVDDPAGGVWIEEGDGHLVHINRSGSERILVPFMEWSVSFTVDDAGRIYAVDFAGRAVYVYDEGRWREFAALAWLPRDAYVTSIAIASDGTLWISTLRGPESEGSESEGSLAHGVAAFDGQAWTIYTTADGLASNEGDVMAAPAGTVWVVHEGAVSRFDGDTWTAYNVDASRFSGAVAGSDGTLWIGTNDGIALVDGDTTTRQVVPTEMAPVLGSFSLEPVGPAAAPADAGSFGEVTWQKYSLPAGHGLTAGIATPYGFAARGSTSIRTSTDGLNWAASEPPVEGRLVASDQDLYALGAGATRFIWTGATWKAAEDLSVPDSGSEILSEGGYIGFERMAFGDGVTVMTAVSRTFFSTDGRTFVPALRGPDPELLEGAGSIAPTDSYASACSLPWLSDGYRQDSIGPVFATEAGFVAFTAGHPRDWDGSFLCEPVIWTSNDGSTWELVSGDSPFGETAYVHDMAEYDGRIIAVGGRSGGSEGVLWVSDDGLTWNEVPPERINGTVSYPWAIAAGEAGWVALFADLETSGMVRAGYSLDGLEWVVDDNVFPDFYFFTPGTPDVAVGKDRILVTYFDDEVLIGETRGRRG